MRRRKSIFLLFLVIIIGYTGCTRSDFPYMDSPKEKIGTKQSEEYENAINALKEFSMAYEKGIETKSPNIVIKKVEISTKPINLTHCKKVDTKSSNETISPDTTSINVYTVIFEKEGNQGFSIVTGDERLTQVYAYTENGNLSDTIYNVGLAARLSEIPYIVEYDLAQIYNNSNVYYATPIDEERTLYIGPLLRTKWNQDYPYNLQCPVMPPCNRNAYAGCTPIAIAQVVAYFDLPRSRYQGTFNYQAINQTTSVPYNQQSMTAKFIRFIGDKTNTGYGCDGSGAWPGDFGPTLDLWGVGYRYDKDANVDISDLIENLNAKRPHITSGQQKTGEKGSHTWVWDGVRGKVRYQNDGRNGITYTPIGTILFSCNWGWGGTADGWYAQSLMEHPTNQNATYLDNNTQLYITSIADNRTENTPHRDNLPPF